MQDLERNETETTDERTLLTGQKLSVHICIYVVLMQENTFPNLVFWVKNNPLVNLSLCYITTKYCFFQLAQV